MLNIDEGRIQRSSSILVKLEWSKMLATPRKGFWNKLWGIIKREPYILTNLLRFSVKNTDSGSVYSIFLELEPKAKFSELINSKVKVFCSCNDFKFRSAYILNKENNLVLFDAIEKHLGIAIKEKPRVVNPSKMCKHIFAVISWIKSNYNKLNLNYE